MKTYIKKKTNILIVGSNEKFTLDSIYYRTFKRLGYNVDFFNIEKSINHRIVAYIKNYFTKINYKLLRKKIIFFFKNKKKKYETIIFFKSIYLDKNTLLAIKHYNGKACYVNIFPDDPFDIKNSTISNKSFLNSIDEFDLFCIWSKKILKNLKKKFKTRFIYLPFAYDSLDTRYQVRKNIKRIDQVFFLGTYDKKRFETLNSINCEKKIYGGNWSGLKRNTMSNSFIGQHIYGKNIHKLANESAISLNILRKQNMTSHNMKTFEIPSYNGLMLTTRSDEQNSFFKENVSCFMYSSKKELNKKIKFIFSNPKKAEKVRKNGNKVIKKHNYSIRVKFIMSQINQINK